MRDFHAKCAKLGRPVCTASLHFTLSLHFIPVCSLSLHSILTGGGGWGGGGDLKSDDCIQAGLYSEFYSMSINQLTSITISYQYYCLVRPGSYKLIYGHLYSPNLLKYLKKKILKS